MSLSRNLLNDLDSIKQILFALSDKQFCIALTSLSGSSLGQHVRHIIEFYQALLQRQSPGTVCYDDRNRDKRIENDRAYALAVIDSLALKLSTIDETETVVVAANYSESYGTLVHHASSVSREMGYVLEHSIHHQALIKIGMSELGLRADRRIGVAAAT